MIVPSAKLSRWVALIALPAALLGAALPELLPWCLAAGGMLLVAVLADALLAVSRPTGIRVELPPVVRCSKDRAADLEIRLGNPAQTLREIRLGLPFPPELKAPTDIAEFCLPAGTEWSRVSMKCLPLRRGNYALRQAFLESDSRLGFWLVRAATPVTCEVRVYPNLLTERRHLAALFLQRGSFGIHAQRQVGKGRDFEKLRNYIPGDSYDEVHWKATAKRGHPVTKIFQIERTQEVYVILDASRLSARTLTHAAAGQVSHKSSESFLPVSSLSPGEAGGEGRGEGAPESIALEHFHREHEPSHKSAGPALSPPSPHATRGRAGEKGAPELMSSDHALFPPQPETTLERFLTAALVLGLAAEKQGDLFGVAAFSDHVLKFLRARNGKSHYAHCRDALYTLQPQLVSPDFEELATFIRLRLRRRSLLVILTALDDTVLAEGFVRSLDLLCRQHLVLVNMLKPPGVEPLFAKANVTSTDDVYERLAGHLRWAKLRELEQILRRRGVRFSLLENERLSAQLVSQYLGVKQRQLL